MISNITLDPCNLSGLGHRNKLDRQLGSVFMGMRLMRLRWSVVVIMAMLFTGATVWVVWRPGLPEWLTVEGIVSASAFFTAIVTAAVTVRTARLGRQALDQQRQALDQEAGLRAKEHSQAALDMNFRLQLDLDRDYFQNPHIIHNRCEAASALLEGKYSIGLQDLMDFFERMATMLLQGAIDRESTYESFQGRLTRYWTKAMPLVEKERTNPDYKYLWEPVETVNRIFLEMKASRLGCTVAEAVPSEETIDRFLREEASLRTDFRTQAVARSWCHPARFVRRLLKC